MKRGDVIAFVGESGTRFPHLHLNFFDSWGAKIDPMLHGVFYPGFIPSIPLFDYKADLDVPIDQRENYLAQYQEKDELDRRLGNYDGPERRALQSARGNVARMKELLLNATAKTKKHTPGSPIYTVALEVFTFSADEDRLAVTHPLKEM